MAWATRTQIAKPQSLSVNARRLGLDGIDLMINAMPPASSLGTISEVPSAQVEECIKVLQGDGLHVELTTWLSPLTVWMQELERVGEIAERWKTPIVLDAEEPWILPLGRKSAGHLREWSERAIGALRRHTSQPIAVTHIVYGNQQILGELLRLANGGTIPQAYATKLRWADKKPGALEHLAVDRWNNAGRRHVELGQAAWDLVGAYRALTAEQAIRHSLSAALARGVTRVRYWSFAHFARLSPRAIDTIKSFRHGAPNA